MQVRFRSEAVSDVEAARRWYDEQRPGLGADFVGSFQEVVELTAELPEACPEIAVGLRRALLRRFPYAVYYRVSEDVVEVIACLHNRRSQSRWRNR